MTDTPLSPAEANFLLKPNATGGMPSIKLTLMFMLSKGVLRIEQTESPGLFRTKSTPHLRIAAEPPDAPPPIAALLAVVRTAQAAGGTIKAVIAEANKAFGTGCGLFNANFVVPPLIARGYLTEKKILFLRAYHVTEAGEIERAQIRSALFKANDLPRLVASDPAQAAAVAASLGALILLSDKATKQFKPLADAVRAQGGQDYSAFTGNDGGGFDFGSFDLGSCEAGVVSAFDAGMSAIDAGFSDAGGGDGGHHGN